MKRNSKSRIGYFFLGMAIAAIIFFTVYGMINAEYNTLSAGIKRPRRAFYVDISDVGVSVCINDKPYIIDTKIVTNFLKSDVFPFVLTLAMTL